MTRKAQETLNRRKERPQRLPVTIRLPEKLVKEIDLDLELRSIPVSRNSWLLEAVIEKLKANGSRGSNGKE